MLELSTGSVGISWSCKMLKPLQDLELSNSKAGHGEADGLSCSPVRRHFAAWILTALPAELELSLTFTGCQILQFLDTTSYLLLKLEKHRQVRPPCSHRTTLTMWVIEEYFIVWHYLSPKDVASSEKGKVHLKGTSVQHLKPLYFGDCPRLMEVGPASHEGASASSFVFFFKILFSYR